MRYAAGLVLAALILFCTFACLGGDNPPPTSGIIFFGTSDSEVAEVIQLAKEIGAKEVYFYVGYESKVYARKPKALDSFGLAYKGDEFVRRAIAQFHRQNLRVTAVFSSQLFGPQPPLAAVPLLQKLPDGSSTDLIDPVKARDLFLALTGEAASYGIDGVFIGEPYYADYRVRKSEPERSLQWNFFYGQINQTLHANYPKLETKLILPVHYFYYQGFKFGAGEEDHGLNLSLVKQDFTQAGLDLSSIYQTGSGDELKDTEVMAALAKKLGGQNAVTELSVNRYGGTSKVPVDFLVKQIEVLRRYDVNHILFFSDKSLKLYSPDELKRLKTALQEKKPNQKRTYRKVLLNMGPMPNWRQDIARQIEAARSVADGKSLLEFEVKQ